MKKIILSLLYLPPFFAHAQFLESINLSKEIYINGFIEVDKNSKTLKTITLKEINSKDSVIAHKDLVINEIINNENKFQFYGPLKEGEIEPIINNLTYQCIDFRLFQIEPSVFHVYVRPCK